MDPGSFPSGSGTSQPSLKPASDRICTGVHPVTTAFVYSASAPGNSQISKNTINMCFTTTMMNSGEL